MLDKSLVERLQAKRVKIEITRDDTITLRKVPVNQRFFNKPLSNLLIKKDETEQLVFIFVDEDLEYSGSDKTLMRAFAVGLKQARWRMLWHGPEYNNHLDSIVGIALTALGFDGQHPALLSHAMLLCKEGNKRKNGLLEAFGVNLTQRVIVNQNCPTVGREEEIEQVVSSVRRWGQTRLALIVGESGVGKTNLLYTVAQKLSKQKHLLILIVVHLADVLAMSVSNRHLCALLMDMLNNQGVPDDTIVALEHVELALSWTYGNIIFSQFLDNGGTLIGTTLPQYLPAFQRGPLARRVQVIDLPELTPIQTRPVLASACKQISSYYQADVNDLCISACIRAAQQSSGCFPGKAIALLDATVARAIQEGAKVVGPDDIYFNAQRFTTMTDYIDDGNGSSNG